MLNQCIRGAKEQQQAVRDLVQLGFGGAIVEICSTLQIDGGWLELLALNEMLVSETI